MTPHYIPPPKQAKMLQILSAAYPQTDDLWRMMVWWMRQRIDPDKPLHGEMVAALDSLINVINVVADRITDADDEIDHSADGVAVWLDSEAHEEMAKDVQI
jgi:hypothetical protein